MHDKIKSKNLKPGIQNPNMIGKKITIVITINKLMKKNQMSRFFLEIFEYFFLTFTK